jgi:hypothetical protein|tara:strand:+ start:448 stop:624 length:177 start_codon:yes stop_codon:yes gene_type:complete
MNLILGNGQEVSIHDIKSIQVEQTEKAFEQYYKTLVITTQDNQEVQINLFSKDKEVLL